ncbi:hypothetical protein CHARACLAT_027369 [Characodon lateralis]|uniref:Uncharacterized protein n=1 Tax=Characodon lateralis TaxID=208331 RepID=A0ABU7DKR0_9TELE|nr:hypothetical protein [Characodon lateralis]
MCWRPSETFSQHSAHHTAVGFCRLKGKKIQNGINRSTRCVSSAQNLPPVGHIAAGKLFIPLLYWCRHTAAAQGTSVG